MKKRKIFETLSPLSRLPRKRTDLDETWYKGKAPKPSDLLGPEGAVSLHLVTMRGGFPNFGRSPLWHHKRFCAVDGVRGCNVMDIVGRWGGFHLEEKDGYLLINYDVTENGRLSRRIRDHVRTTDDPNVLIGRFHVMIRGREKFLFYFFLSRIKE